MQRKPGVQCFMHSQYDVTYVEFKTFYIHNFAETDQNARKLCSWLFLCKYSKGMS